MQVLNQKTRKTKIVQNKHLKLLLIALIVTFIIPQITLAAWYNPFSWGIWNSIFHFQQQTQKVTQQQKLVGNDRDSHGCISSAGYTWCAVKNKCLRTWEEKCETASLADQTMGNFLFSIVAADNSSINNRFVSKFDLEIRDNLSKKIIQKIPLGWNIDGLASTTPINQIVSMDDDINFDGYNDLKVLTQTPASNPGIYDFYIYDPQTGRFNKDSILQNLVGPIFDPKTKTISTETSSGCAGQDFIKATLSFISNNYVLTETSQGDCCNLSGTQEGSGITVNEYKNGKIESAKINPCPQN